VTYSIVARDAATGELGVAVQSHYFQVGPVVPWALAGVGAIATQSRVNVAYGPSGLELLKQGFSAEETLRALTAGDTQADVRQCGIVDAMGGVTAHTGAKCIPAAGHVLGDGFTCQANLMDKDTVWRAMSDAFTSTQGPLAERMLAAMEAAEAEGGDIRGKQSAAILVVSGKPTGREWEDRTVDLRVEDAPEPLPELRRLLRIRRAYDTAGDADHLAEGGDKAAARARLMEALALAPEIGELRFWGGLDIAMNGDLDDGVRLMSEVVESEGKHWIETMKRLVLIGSVPADLAAEIEARLTTSSRAK
jgi:uncharacterized Ntn-hydrolase superfamily protein